MNEHRNAARMSVRPQGNTFIRRYLPLAIAAGFPLMTAMHAAAQTPPPVDSGTVLDSMKSSGAPPLRKASPDVQVNEPVKPAMDAPAGLRVKVAGFKLTGNTVFSEAELLPVIDSLSGREVSFVDLDQAAAAISNYYRERGYLVARAYLPQQEIVDGKVEIAVLEGRLSAVAVDTKDATRLDPERVKQIIAGSAAPGTVVREEDLERGLLLANDLPGVDVKSTLTPGASVGTTDLMVEVKEGDALSGSVDLDTFGSRYTGVARLGVTLNINDPTGYGDLISFRGMNSGAGLALNRLSYALPVGDYGTRLGVAYAHARYDLQKDLAVTEGQGQASVAGLFAQHPIVRSRAYNAYFSAGYDAKHLEDKSLGVIYSDRRIRVLGLALNGDMRDGIGGGGVSSVGLTYTAGSLDLDNALNRDNDAKTARTQGHYKKWNYSLTRLQRLTDNVSGYFSFQGQRGRKNLDSSEKMSAGGPLGVRAYPTGEAPSDSADLLNLEARWDLPLDQTYGVPQLVAFYDQAWVERYQQIWASSGLANNRYSLSGAGVGFNLNKPADYQLRLALAWKTGHNSGRDALGRDSDNKNDSGRVWLQMVKWF